MKKIKRKLLAGLLSFVFLLGIGSVVSNAVVAYYTAWKLPPRKINVYSNIKRKETSLDYMTNTVTALSYANTVDVWVCDKDKNVISYDYNQKVGSFQKLYFKLPGYDKEGTFIRMGMQNGRWEAFKNAFVSGVADFK